jgi:hypothetical protein
LTAATPDNGKATASKPPRRKFLGFMSLVKGAVLQRGGTIK